jgi:hypothetical protein
LTHSGEYFDFLQPQDARLDIKTIAHSLSHLCRFTGHTDVFYSVAQHSVLVSHLVPREYALAGLLHDAAEAFLGDVSAPLKQLLPEYKVIESRVEAVVFPHFGLPVVLPDEVKIADWCALATEQRDLMPRHEDVWPWESIEGVSPSPLRIIAMQPYIAKAYFLSRYHELRTFH